MTTKADLMENFKGFVEQCDRCGLAPSITEGGKQKEGEWVLQEGSKTYGRAYRMFWKPVGGSGALYQPSGFSSYLGMTRKEASITLWNYTCGLYAARVYGTLKG